MTAPCKLNIKYPNKSDLFNTLRNNMTDIKLFEMDKGLVVKFWLEWQASCDQVPGYECTDSQCEWANQPIHSKVEVSLSLHKVIPALDWDCMKILYTACHHGDHRGTTSDCINKALADGKTENGGFSKCPWKDLDDMLDDVDIFALTDLLEQAVADLPQRFCDCTRRTYESGLTNQDIWVVNKAIKSNFDAGLKRDLGN